MENVENLSSMSYISVLYRKIDDLILMQKDVYGENILDEHGNLDSARFDRFMEIQKEINHLYDLKSKAQDRAVQQVCYNQLMRQNSVKDARKSTKMEDYVFLTINPPDSIDYSVVVKAVKQFTHLSVCQWAAYVFEQRQVDEGDYRGFHCHILFRRNKKPYEVEKEMDRIFLYNIVPDKHKMKMWSRPNMSDVKNAFGYLNGSKADECKQAKLNNDVRMRVHYGLETMYIVGDCPLLVRQSGPM